MFTKEICRLIEHHFYEALARRAISLETSNSYKSVITSSNASPRTENMDNRQALSLNLAFVLMTVTIAKES